MNHFLRKYILEWLIHRAPLTQLSDDQASTQQETAKTPHPLPTSTRWLLGTWYVLIIIIALPFALVMGYFLYLFITVPADKDLEADRAPSDAELAKLMADSGPAQPTPKQATPQKASQQQADQQ